MHQNLDQIPLRTKPYFSLNTNRCQEDYNKSISKVLDIRCSQQIMKGCWSNDKDKPFEQSK